MSAIALLTTSWSRGTAFLVSRDGHMLTAAHCLTYQGATPEDPKWIDADELELHFGEPGKEVVATAVLPPVAWDIAEDWALFKCTPTPPVEPLVLSGCDGSMASWHCWGFPTTIQTGENYQPLAYDGSITAVGKRIQLSFKQLGEQTRVAGMSGAPVLVGREVVGLIGQAVEEEDEHRSRRAIEPILFAVPVPVHGLEGARVEVRPATYYYQAMLASLLALDSGTQVDLLAQKFKLAPSLPPEGRKRAVARHLLSRRPETVARECNLLKFVDVKRPDLVGHLLAANCLGDETLDATRRHLGARDAAAHGATVYGEQPLTGRLYAVGAGLDLFGNELWNRVFELSLPEGEAGDTAALLLGRLCQTIARRFNFSTVDPDALWPLLESELGAGEPFFVTITSPVSREAVDLIRKHLPGARVVLRSERPEALDPKSLPLIEPTTARDHERAIAEAFASMSKTFREPR